MSTRGRKAPPSRTNISLPFGLLTELRKNPGINWSAVCEQALRRVVRGVGPEEELARLSKENRDLKSRLLKLKRVADELARGL